MTDIRADDALDDGDRLPWLEAVEDDESDGPAAGKLIAFVIIGLVAIGLIVGGLFWLGNRRGASTGGTGAPEVIAAPQGDYKVKPAQAGGMKVEGEGQTVFAAGAGADPKGKIDVSAVPEAPVTKPTPVAKASPAPTPSPVASKAKPEPAEPPAASGGGSIQLGAFSSEASANAAWKAMAGRFGYLAPLSHSVTTVASGARTLYRLRASGPGASEICGRLRVAGEQCVAV